MSQPAKINGGSPNRNIAPSHLGASSGTKGTAATVGPKGALRGHKVEQLAAPQVPGQRGGIGQRIAHFFRSLLPSFFKNLALVVIGLAFSRPSAPAPAPAASQPTATPDAKTADRQEPADAARPRSGVSLGTHRPKQDPAATDADAPAKPPATPAQQKPADAATQDELKTASGELADLDEVSEVPDTLKITATEADELKQALGKLAGPDEMSEMPETLRLTAAEADELKQALDGLDGGVPATSTEAAPKAASTEGLEVTSVTGGRKRADAFISPFRDFIGGRSGQG